ncbi:MULTISPECIES: hypothetical protein [Mesorhizobium]|nr:MULTISPECIES: hypothetical protein [Mesorhizobium]AMX93755.1 hypothetical protein A4R28_11885 [Mesorhizobium ciceri]MDF3228974.1 hypothetical protein [Mesorhizobium sp. DSM 30133]RUU22094.1 hypothetical protein EOC84_03005 [Mesorhizobium sp. Primo-B]RUU37996.1 hypothetical protein EOC83_17210 [Mesorhizobium sp. Primo-A]RVB69038.1 hypothetical protein EN895_01730 [Mesorhizobium sp. M7A.F.Ca.CA.002.03.2.1]
MTGDRICCVNPRCGRTAPRDKCGDSADIICRRCWKQLPKQITDRFKALRRRDNSLSRLIDRRFAAGTMPQYRINMLGEMIDAQAKRNWEAIRAYFRDPEKPEGLENFLADIGLENETP